MKIGILSDTHDKLRRTREAVSLLLAEGAEVIFHCGDVTGPEIVHACAARPSYFVFGNNDSDNVPQLRRAIAEVGGTCLDWGGEATLAGKRIGLVHGHMTRDVRRVLGPAPDYVFSGHSHIAGDWQEGPTQRINPGALHRATVFTVAVLDLATGELHFLTVAP